MEPMYLVPAYYVGIHRYSSHPGEPGKIEGVMVVTPADGSEPRPCFVVKWMNPNDTVAYDYCPVSETQHYKIISAKDIFEHKIPEVTR